MSPSAKSAPKTRLKQYADKKGTKEKNLYQDTDGKYHVRFFHNEKVFTKKLLALTIKDARTERDQFIVDVRGSALNVVSRKDIPTVMKAIGLWEKAKTGTVTDKYLADTVNMFKALLDPIGHVFIDKVSKTQINSIISDYHNKNIVTNSKHSEGTTNNRIGQIKSLFSLMVDQEWIRFSPADRIKRLTRPEKKRTVLNIDTTNTFLEAVDTIGLFHVSFQVRAMYYLGLRNSEARHLNWASYDPTEETYTPGQHKLTKGKEAKSIDIPEEMTAWIKRAAQQEHKNLTYMCVNPDTGKPYDASNLGYHMDVISKKIGIKLTPHSIRASYITLLSQTLDLPTVQQLARHADIKTTMIYITVDKKRKREGVRSVFPKVESKTAE